MHWRLIKIVRARGFGFVRDLGGRVMLFHRSELKETDFDALVVGTSVEFNSERGPQGFQTVNIHRLET